MPDHTASVSFRGRSKVITEEDLEQVGHAERTLEALNVRPRFDEVSFFTHRILFKDICLCLYINELLMSATLIGGEFGTRRAS